MVFRETSSSFWNLLSKKMHLKKYDNHVTKITTKRAETFKI